MTANWLALRSFQRNQRLLKAINTLSIHLQLALSGDQTPPIPAVDEAIGILDSFFSELQAGIQQVADSGSGVIHGADPRFQALVDSYMEAQSRSQSSFFAESVNKIRELLYSTEKQDQQVFVGYLAKLRTLIEEQIDHDIDQIY